MEHIIPTARGRLTLDLALFVALFIASRPAWTGTGFHQWLAFLLIVPALYHLVVNWDWVMRIVPRLIEKLAAMPRVNLVIDFALFMSVITVCVSGVMVIPGVLSADPTSAEFGVWLKAHSVASDITIVMLLAHTFTHLRWIADAVYGRIPLDDPLRAEPSPIDAVPPSVDGVAEAKAYPRFHDGGDR